MAEKDANELTPEEATALAYERSNASKEDFNPADPDFPAEDRVVELPDRASVAVADLVDHPDPLIAADAQATVDGTNPGGPNWPNGTGNEEAPRTEAPAEKKVREQSAGTSQASQSNENK